MIHVSFRVASWVKKQALKWHPDRNINKDTTVQMQDINEAKLILLDIEARERYNQEYFRFKNYQKEQQSKTHKEEKFDKKDYQEDTYGDEDYTVEDDILDRKMSNARKKAVDLAKETIENLRGMTKAGVDAAFDNIGYQLPTLLIVALICLIIALLSKL